MSRYTPPTKSSVKEIADVAKKQVDTKSLALARSKLISEFAPQIAAALPKHLTADRITRIMLTEVSKNPLLAECDRESLYGAIIVTAQLGLEPGNALGHSYLVPFFNNKKGHYEAQLIIGYKGMIQLVANSGLAVIKDATVVCKGDQFEWERGTESFIRHREDLSNLNRGKTPDDVICSYAIATIFGQIKEHVFEIAPRAVIDRARSFSKNLNMWRDNFNAMATKTAIRLLYKRLPASSEILRTADLLETRAEKGQSQALDAIAAVQIKDPSEVEKVLIERVGNIDLDDKSFAAEIAETEAAEMAAQK